MPKHMNNKSKYLENYTGKEKPVNGLHRIIDLDYEDLFMMPRTRSIYRVVWLPALQGLKSLYRSNLPLKAVYYADNNGKVFYTTNLEFRVKKL